MKILIVEDEINIAKGIASVLCSQEKYKCQIQYADNGKSALEMTENFHPDIVITDVKMPGITGLQLAEQLKQRNICSKVVIISGYGKFEYAQKALRANVMDYLLKPVDKQHLLDLVERVWRELPSNYALNKRDIILNHVFFNLDLDYGEYPESLKKAIDFIKRKYMEDISIMTLSEELMLHPNYLSTLINKHLKVNFSHLLDYIRLEVACKLLLSEPDMTISEISYVVGYNNERRLYNAFSKRLNCTPGDFRKNIIIK